MRLLQLLNEEREQPTKEMYVYFRDRTKKHIDRVAKNLKKIGTELEGLSSTEMEEIHKRMFSHDNSKYGREEMETYVWISWWYKHKNEGKPFDYPESVKGKVDKAWKHHILVNKHHPEHHKNSSDMSKVDIIEMVADWAALSQELNSSLKKWADQSIGKWKFTKEQEKFIYDLVRMFE